MDKGRWPARAAIVAGAVTVLSPGAGRSATADVEAKNFSSSPDVVSIGVGDRATWRNVGPVALAALLGGGTWLGRRARTRGW